MTEKDKIIEFKENKKFINEDDVGDNIKFILDKKGNLTIRTSSLQCSSRHIDLDKNQVKRLIKFLK